jgi:predicted metalloendopeptidase
MGWAIGRVYVARYFPPESKVEMEHLTDELKAAFHVRLEHNSWMGPATRTPRCVSWTISPSRSATPPSGETMAR